VSVELGAECHRRLGVGDHAAFREQEAPVGLVAREHPVGQSVAREAAGEVGGVEHRVGQPVSWQERTEPAKTQLSSAPASMLPVWTRSRSPATVSSSRHSTKARRSSAT
jgi:hypothetical protein